MRELSEGFRKTIIQYTLPSQQPATFSFYNLQGAAVGNINAGIQQVTFDGSQLANGMYFFTLIAGQDSYTGSFIIQR